MIASRWIRGASCVVAVLGTMAGRPVHVRSQAMVPIPDGKPPQAAAADAKGVASYTMLKVTVTIARYQGEKKVGNLPYTLFVATGGNGVNLRMNSNVPVPTSVVNGTKDGQFTSFQYQQVGTNIDASAKAMTDGKYALSLTISDNQLSVGPEGPSRAATGGMPAIQSFTTSTVLYLRDGQTVQYTTATDKVTGDVIKVDVALEVLK